jgi:hypothetical protein
MKRCRICLAPAKVTVVGGSPNRRTESTLGPKGVCRDRAACELRQPALIPMAEVTPGTRR